MYFFYILGVANAIAKKAGPEFDEECQEIVKKGELMTGETCRTLAYQLPCKYVRLCL